MSLTRPPGALLLALFGAAFALPLGCPQPECRYFDDCGPGMYCQSDMTCAPTGIGDGDGDVTGDGDGDGDGVGDGDGDGDGDGADDLAVQTANPIQWLMEDPRQPGRILVPQYQPGQIAGFTYLDSDDPPSFLDNTVDIDLIAMSSENGTAPCDPDNVYFEGTLSAGADETWLICGESTNEGDVRVVYDGNYNANFHPASFSGQVVVEVESAFDGELDVERRLVFKRGGAPTVIQLFDQYDQPYGDPRRTDTIMDIAASNVTQAWQIQGIGGGQNPADYPADYLLLFDRSDPPRLVPIMRRRASETWEPNDLGLLPVELPSETHAVVMFPDQIDAQGTQLNVEFNVIALLPELGEARFYNYAGGQLVENYVGSTFYETIDLYQAPPPAASERLLLEPSPTGQYVFYAHPELSRAWRIPVDDFGQEDRVLRNNVQSADFQIRGIVPISETQAWLAAPSQNLLYRETFAQSN